MNEIRTRISRGRSGLEATEPLSFDLPPRESSPIICAIVWVYRMEGDFK